MSFLINTMLLTYQFEIKVNNKLGIILGHLTYAASKLFNVGNYERKEYKSLGFDKMPDWYDQKKRLKDDIWYKSLPSQTSQEILAILDRSWKSYLTLHNKWEKKNKDVPMKDNKNEPQSPYYKKNGYHININYLSNGFKVTSDKIRFSIPKKLKEHLNDKYQINDNFFYIKLKRHFDDIKQIEFSYLDKDRYIVYVIYEKDIKRQVEDNKHYISIDIGVKNLLSVYDNNGSSFIVSGHSILNTNYYFSKKIAYYQSLFDKCYPNHKKGETTKRIKHLYDMKNKRIKLALHRATRTIVDYCLSHDVSKVIIGDLMADVLLVVLSPENYIVCLIISIVITVLFAWFVIYFFYNIYSDVNNEYRFYKGYESGLKEIGEVIYIKQEDELTYINGLYAYPVHVSYIDGLDKTDKVIYAVKKLDYQEGDKLSVITYRRILTKAEPHS